MNDINSSGYWDRPQPFDIAWLESHPNYPSWDELAQCYREGETAPLIAALRRGDYAPPRPILALLADVLDGTFKPPRRGKSNAKLSRRQVAEVSSVIRMQRRSASRMTEERADRLLRQELGRIPTHREVESLMRHFRRMPQMTAEAYAKKYGVATGTILAVVEPLNKRR